MKIVDVETIWLRVPGLDDACEWGEDAFLVRVHTDEGLIGVGEADSSPAVMCALIDTPESHSTSRGLRQILIGENPLDIDRLWRKMYDQSSYMGRRGAAIHAISAIDIALWDIASQKYGEPIHRLLGGRVRDSIPAYGTFIPKDQPDANREIVARLVDEGFDTIKLGGAKFGLEPTHDAAVLRAVRKQAGTDIGLAIDLVGRWRNFRYAYEQQERMLEFDLSWIEEPLASDDHLGLRRLSESSRTPISGGEGLTTRTEFSDFIRQTQPDIVQPDITRCGGITEMRHIQILADQYSTRLVPHGFSTGILTAATVQFLAASPGGDLIEYSRSTSPLSTKLVTNVPPLQGGYVPVSDSPGLGVELDEDFLTRYRVRTSWSSAGDNS